MADSDNILASLLINGQRSIAEEDPYLQFKAVPDSLARQAIGAQGYGTKERVIAGLLTGLLSGGAQGLSNDYQNRANEAYGKTVEALLNGNQVERPGVLSPSIFNTARQNANVFNVVKQQELRDAATQFAAARQAKLQDTLLEKQGIVIGRDGQPVAVPQLDPAAIEANKKIAALKAEDEYYGQPGVDNPNSPGFKFKQEQEKALENARDTFEKTPTFQNFSISDKGYRSLLKAIDDPAATSDLELVRGAIQAIEPGMAVREGEATAAENSGSIPQAWKGAISKALKGESGLAPEIREGILRIAQRRYDEQARAFNLSRDLKINEAKRRGFPNPEAISYYGKAQTAADLMKELRQSTPLTTPAPGNIIKAPDGKRILIK